MSNAHGTRGPARIIVLRGDLYSDTGYGRATRALGRVLQARSSRLFGVSLHEHERRKHNAASFPLITDRQIAEDPRFEGALVVNVCLPDAFIRVPRAINIGYFFWETARLPLGTSWKANMALMDRIWAPSRWQSGFLREATGRTDIPVIPWPLDELPPIRDCLAPSLLDMPVHAPMTRDQFETYALRSSFEGSRPQDLERGEHDGGRAACFDPASSPRLREIRGACTDMYLAVQTDAPRKGFPLLLTSWLAFKQTLEGAQARLVVRLSSVDVTADMHRLHSQASLAVQRACMRFGVCSPDIWFLYDRLSDFEMRSLLASASALVSASLGEGFGGPVAEALLEGTPVIVPGHSSIRDIIGDDYPLAVSFSVHNLKLWNNIDVYSPSSTWHVVDDVSFVDCLKTFSQMSAQERRTLSTRARENLLARAGVDAVSRSLSDEMRITERLRADRTQPLDRRHNDHAQMCVGTC